MDRFVNSQTCGFALVFYILTLLVLPPPFSRGDDHESERRTEVTSSDHAAEARAR